jgi:predicted permease
VLHVLNVLLPVFLMIALGGAFRASRFLPDEFFRHLNKLVFWVGLPSFLFVKILAADFRASGASRLFGALLTVFVVTTLLAWPVGAAFRLGRRSLGVFVQAAQRANLAYIGWPVIAYAFAPRGAGQSDAILAMAVLVVAALVPIYNVVAVLLLIHAREGGAPGDPVGRAASVRRAAVSLVTNPLIVACVAALLIRALGLSVPLALRRTAEAMGQFSLPLALMSIGAGFMNGQWTGRWTVAAWAAGLRVGLGPILAWAASRWLGLTPDETRVATICMACPTAVASYVLADQMGADAGLAGKAVVVSTALSFLSLGAVLYWTS